MKTLFRPLKLIFRFLVCGILITVATTRTFSQEGDQIFPADTLGFVSIRNVDVLIEQWNHIQLGKMLADPKMEPFVDSLCAELQQVFAEKIGLSFDAIQKIPTGEVAAGLVATSGRRPGYALILDIAGKEKETADYVENTINDAVAKKIAVQTAVTIGIHHATQATFTITPENGTAPVQRDVYFLIVGKYLLVSPQSGVAELLATRIQGNRAGSLAEKRAFQYTQERCVAERPKIQPHQVPLSTPPLIRWYLEPLTFGTATREMAILNAAASTTARPFRRDTRKKPVTAVLAEQGFDAIHGIGGTVDFLEHSKELVHRTFVFAPKPYTGGMKMLSFINSSDFAAPQWMPTGVAQYSVWHFDPLAVFDNIESVFDAMAGEGAWKDVINGMKEDPQGLQIDLREELMTFMDTTTYGSTSYRQPITTDSERMVVGIGLKPGGSEAVEKALVKLFQDDHGMEQVNFRCGDGQEVVIWQTVTVDTGYRPPPSLPIYIQQNPIAVEIDENEEPLFPNGGVTVCGNTLFMANDVSHLKEILSQKITSIGVATSSQSLLSTSSTSSTSMVGTTVPPQFQPLETVFVAESIGAKPHFFQQWKDTAATTRLVFETLRQGKMPQSEAMLARIINGLFFPTDEDNPQVRDALVDGTKMPPFDEVSSYFGTACVYGSAENDGFLIQGFSLPPSP